VHNYEEDWDRLWWVRIDGTATIHDSGEHRQQAIAALVDKYEQYRGNPPAGEVIWIQTAVTSSWASMA
jgi:hypothetical protein